MKEGLWIEKYASGKYMVYFGRQRLPAVILGGNGRWIVEYRSQQWKQVYKSAKAAAKAVLDYHTKGKPIDGNEQEGTGRT